MGHKPSKHSCYLSSGLLSCCTQLGRWMPKLFRNIRVNTPKTASASATLSTASANSSPSSISKSTGDQLLLPSSPTTTISKAINYQQSLLPKESTASSVLAAVSPSSFVSSQPSLLFLLTTWLYTTKTLTFSLPKLVHSPSKLRSLSFSGCQSVRLCQTFSRRVLIRYCSVFCWKRRDNRR